MWILAQTKTKQEKIASKNIINQGFKTFLPEINRKKFKNAKWRDTSELLFPGYIFINIADKVTKIGPLSHTIGVFKLLVDKMTATPYVIDQSLIDNIIKINTININTISKGSNIYVAKGCTNLSGIFVEKKGTKRALILLKILSDYRETIVNYEDIQPAFY